MQIATLFAALCLAFSSVAEARTQRSHRAIAEFKSSQPCPATGARRGPCPGYQIDHIIPLKCNGADSPENMQWLTIAAHKAKTARESKWCRR